MTKAEETKETKKRPRGPTNRSEALTCTVGEFEPVELQLRIGELAIDQPAIARWPF